MALPRVTSYPILTEWHPMTKIGAALVIPAKERKKHPLLNKHAPEIKLLDPNGRLVSLHSTMALGRPICLYFFPLAGSPHCTKQSCSLREALNYSPVFDNLGAIVIGISQDAPNRAKRFSDNLGLNFQLLCDIDREAMNTYHVGHSLLGLINSRCTFIIDHLGIIRAVLEGVWDGTGHARFAERWLTRLEHEMAGTKRHKVEIRSAAGDLATVPSPDGYAYRFLYEPKQHYIPGSITANLSGIDCAPRYGASTLAADLNRSQSTRNSLYQQPNGAQGGRSAKKSSPLSLVRSLSGTSLGHGGDNASTHGGKSRVQALPSSPGSPRHHPYLSHNGSTDRAPSVGASSIKYPPKARSASMARRIPGLGASHAFPSSSTSPTGADGAGTAMQRSSSEHGTVEPNGKRARAATTSESVARSRLWHGVSLDDEGADGGGSASYSFGQGTREGREGGSTASLPGLGLDMLAPPPKGPVAPPPRSSKHAKHTASSHGATAIPPPPPSLPLPIGTAAEGPRRGSIVSKLMGLGLRRRSSAAEHAGMDGILAWRKRSTSTATQGPGPNAGVASLVSHASDSTTDSVPVPAFAANVTPSTAHLVSHAGGAPAPVSKSGKKAAARAAKEAAGTGKGSYWARSGSPPPSQAIDRLDKGAATTSALGLASDDPRLHTSASPPAGGGSISPSIGDGDGSGSGLGSGQSAGEGTLSTTPSTFGGSPHVGESLRLPDVPAGHPAGGAVSAELKGGVSGTAVGAAAQGPTEPMTAPATSETPSSGAMPRRPISDSRSSSHGTRQVRTNLGLEDASGGLLLPRVGTPRSTHTASPFSNSPLRALEPWELDAITSLGTFDLDSPMPSGGPSTPIATGAGGGGGGSGGSGGSAAFGPASQTVSSSSPLASTTESHMLGHMSSSLLGSQTKSDAFISTPLSPAPRMRKSSKTRLGSAGTGSGAHSHSSSYDRDWVLSRPTSLLALRNGVGGVSVGGMVGSRLRPSTAGSSPSVDTLMTAVRVTRSSTPPPSTPSTGPRLRSVTSMIDAGARRPLADDEEYVQQTDAGEVKLVSRPSFEIINKEEGVAQGGVLTSVDALSVLSAFPNPPALKRAGSSDAAEVLEDAATVESQPFEGTRRSSIFGAGGGNGSGGAPSRRTSASSIRELAAGASNLKSLLLSSRPSSRNSQRARPGRPDSFAGTGTVTPRRDAVSSTVRTPAESGSTASPAVSSSPSPAPAPLPILGADGRPVIPFSPQDMRSDLPPPTSRRNSNARLHGAPAAAAVAGAMANSSASASASPAGTPVMSISLLPPPPSPSTLNQATTPLFAHMEEEDRKSLANSMSSSHQPRRSGSLSISTSPRMEFPPHGGATDGRGSAFGALPSTPSSGHLARSASLWVQGQGGSVRGANGFASGTASPLPSLSLSPSRSPTPSSSAPMMRTNSASSGASLSHASSPRPSLSSRKLPGRLPAPERELPSVPLVPGSESKATTRSEAGAPPVFTSPDWGGAARTPPAVPSKDVGALVVGTSPLLSALGGAPASASAAHQHQVGGAAKTGLGLFDSLDATLAFPTGGEHASATPPPPPPHHSKKERGAFRTGAPSPAHAGVKPSASTSSPTSDKKALPMMMTSSPSTSLGRKTSGRDLLGGRKRWDVKDKATPPVPSIPLGVNPGGATASWHTQAQARPASIAFLPGSVGTVTSTLADARQLEESGDVEPTAF